MKKARIAVFVSGGGTNLEALLKAQEAGAIPHGEIVLVCASNETAYALTRAANHGVPGVAVPKKNLSQADFEAALNEQLREHRIDLIVLAGFLSILSEEFVKQWPDRIINIHPSLIPSFCGMGYYGLKVHAAAIEYGVKLSGATVHFVEADVDGGAIIMQRAVPVISDDTPETLQARILKEEHTMLPLCVKLFCEGKIVKCGRQVRVELD